MPCIYIYVFSFLNKETLDLAVESPFYSFCQMVHMINILRSVFFYSFSIIGSQWRNVVGSWVRSRPPDLFDDSDRERIHKLLEKYLPDCLKFFNLNLKPIVFTNDAALAFSVLRLLETMITRIIVVDDSALESVFVFCLIWGFGSILMVGDDGYDNRKTFNDWFRSKFKSVKVPSRDTVFDYWLDTRTNKFESWKSSPAFSVIEFNSESMVMSDITVPTNETASISFWVNALVRTGSNVMLAGTVLVLLSCAVLSCLVLSCPVSLFDCRSTFTAPSTSYLHSLPLPPSLPLPLPPFHLHFLPSTSFFPIPYRSSRYWQVIYDKRSSLKS